MEDRFSQVGIGGGSKVKGMKGPSTRDQKVGSGSHQTDRPGGWGGGGG